MPGLRTLNAISDDEARVELGRACGASRWVEGMLARRPFLDEEALFAAGREVWRALAESDWREAFSHHPRIGDVASLKERFATTAKWVEGEQAGARGASDAVLEALADGNREYEERFGHLFIVCATGKSAEEMLGLLGARLGNQAEVELTIAAAEQEKITRLRLEKWLST